MLKDVDLDHRITCYQFPLTFYSLLFYRSSRRCRCTMFSLTLLFDVIWYGSFDGDCLNELLTFFPFAFLPRTLLVSCITSVRRKMSWLWDKCWVMLYLSRHQVTGLEIARAPLSPALSEMKIAGAAVTPLPGGCPLILHKSFSEQNKQAYFVSDVCMLPTLDDKISFLWHINMYNDEPLHIRFSWSTFYCCALKEIPRPFARTVELAVVKGFSFPLEGLGLGVRCKLIHHSNRVEMRLYSASPYSGLQWHKRSAVLLGNLFFEVKLFRKRRVVLNKCTCLLFKWNTEFLGGRMKNLGAGGFSFCSGRTRVSTILFYEDRL